MENLRNKNVVDLRQMCRDAGLACSGNKNTLINRLERYKHNEEHYESASSVLLERVAELEKTIREIELRQNVAATSSDFVPPRISSPLDTNTYVRSSNVHTVQSVVPPLQVPTTQMQFSVPLLQVPTSQTQIPVSSLQIPATQTYEQVAYSVPEYTPRYTHVPVYPTCPVISDSPYAPIHHQQNWQPRSTFNVREIIDLLPSFNPISKTSLNATQFIQRVEMLRNAYSIDDNFLLFAVQQKMQGPAKQWVDSLPVVYTTWSAFSNRFIEDFPTLHSVADAHIKMSQMRRGENESPQEFYYRMVAYGNKCGIFENDIVAHIINGINDSALKRKISNSYTRCIDLLRDINNYSIYNDGKINTHSKQKPIQSINPTFGTRNTIPKSNENIKCYNCSKTGHYSIKCPEPQKKIRCGKCQRTNHTTEMCPEKSNAVRAIEPVKNEISDGILKQIKVNGVSTNAFVDPGSSRTLVKESFAIKLGSISTCSITLNGFGGGKYVCDAKINAIVEIDNEKFESDILIVEDNLLNENILLGTDCLCRNGSRLVIENGGCRVENALSKRADTTIDKNYLIKLEQIFSSYRDVFSEKVSDLGRCKLKKMEIELNSQTPVNMKPYRIPFSKRPIVADIIKEILENEIIRPSESPYASPIVLVEKQNGEHRLCIDYRCLNKITTKMSYPMPVMEEHFAQLAGNKYFTTLDLRMGYYQIELEEKSKQFTAFVTNEGHYEFNRMPFGLVNAPAVFQTVMNTLVAKMKTGEVLAYLDDVIIPSRTIEEGLQRIEKFLTLLRESGLTLRIDKCKFLESKIEYLGHVITENSIMPGNRKLSAISNFPAPTNITELRRFLGLTGFFRKFVPEFSLITKPLTTMLRKSERNSFHWNEPQQQAFQRVIDLLTSAPVLALYDQNAQHEVHTDASSIGLAGVLMQSYDGKVWQPTMYYSRHCTEPESRYHSYELEALAVVEVLDRFRIYLLGKKFRLVTDCAAVAKVRDNKELKAKIARWWLKLSEFDFEAVHRSGSRLPHVDAMSRAPDQPAENVEPVGSILEIQADVNDWLYTMQIQDEKLREVVAILRGHVKSDRETELKKYFRIQNTAFIV
ncbi:uncharacterized protein LOC125779690 [Bactrocera dorsalis]|uniref:Uncharacterized protein LOC125779690 n=1 Tax=Bactrocera dorsalis TaxID=27457 RepID=A0ABM3K615_BACDO|nr:uncharacterized protein LOC125779690 [Bactrocera dorsalis]